MSTGRTWAILAGLLAVGHAAAAGIEGRVVAPDGSAVAGATVTAYELETTGARMGRLARGKERVATARVQSGVDGSFRLEGTPRVAQVEVRSPGLAPAFRTVASGGKAVLTMRPAALVRGSVHSGGHPVAGAVVTWVAQGHDLDPGEVRSRTGVDGSYEIEDPGVWASGVTIVHPEFAPLQSAAMEYEVAAPPPLRHELVRGVSITGWVIDEGTGRPVARARVEVDGWPLARSMSDGSFAVPHAPSSWRQLEITADGRVGRARAESRGFRVALQPSRRLYGVVRDAKSGQGLASVLVAVYHEEFGLSSTALTDAAGRYAFTDLAGARYRVWLASRPGYEARSEGHAWQFVDLRRDPSAVRDLSMTPLLEIVGRVDDEEGRPVAGAIVRAWPPDAPLVYATGTGSSPPADWTGADGSFSLELEESWFEEGTGALMVLKQGFAAGRVELGYAARRDYNVSLTRGVEIFGRVTDREGHPIAGASVAVAEDRRFGGVPEAYLKTLMAGGWTTSDADGRFAIRVQDGSYHVGVHGDGRLWKMVHRQTPGSPVDVVLEPAAPIAGWIRRWDGSGIEGVQMLVMGGRSMEAAAAVSSADGGFRFDDIPPGPYQLTFSKPGTALSGTRSLDAPAAGYVVQVEPGATLRGTVRSVTTGAPVDRFGVQIETGSPTDSGDFHGFGPDPIEGVDGAFSIEEVPAGEVTLVVRAEGFVARRVELAVLTDAEMPALEIDLDPGVRIEGRVTGENGLPLADVNVTAEGEDVESSSATTDAQGVYRIEGVSPGSAKLEFRLAGYITVQRTVDAAQSARADATLTRGLVVSGVVLDEGVAVPGAWVTARSSVAGAEHASAETDERGEFTLEGLVPGRYGFNARTRDGAEGVLEDVDVADGGTVRIALERRETATVSGWVTGLDDAEAYLTVTVEVRGEDGGREDAAVDPDGWFRIDNAPAGKVRVQATARGSAYDERTTRALELSLPAGSEAEAVLEFEDGSVVAGHVVLNGTPLPDATVSLRAVDRSGPGSSGRTDVDGRYEVRGLDPGPHSVSVYGMNVSYRLDYTVVGDDRLDIDVTGAAITGLVLDAASGVPLAEASVTLWKRGPEENSPDESLTTGRNGEFSASSLEVGAYRVLATREGFGQQLREVELRRGEAAEVVLELEPSSGLTLAIVDARDGRPLEATVVVRDTLRRIVANEHSGVAADGTVTIPLAPGSYLLSTSAGGYGTVTRPVEAPNTGLRVGLSPGGTVVVESERALRGRIRLVDERGEEYVRCWCNGLAEIQLEGRRTTVDHVTPGSYSLEIVDEAGAATAGLRVSVSEGQTSRVVVE